MSDHSQRKHSKISPSKLGTLEVSPRFQADEDREPHPITLSGTRCHEALETGNLNGLSEEERGFVDYAAGIRLQASQGFETHHVELRVEVFQGIWGFVDDVQVKPRRDYTEARILDWKFGFNRQEQPETNAAAQAYVLGVFNKWPTLQEVSVVYCYPRLMVVETATFTLRDLPGIRTRIAAIVARVKAADPVNPEDCQITDNCQYCRHLATCSTISHNVLPLAKRYAERKEFDLSVELDPARVTDPRHMAVLLNYRTVMKAWVESVEHHAKELRMSSGVEIPGYTVTEQQGKASIQDPNGAYGRFMSHGGTHEEFLNACSVSIPFIAEALGKKAPKGAKGKVEKAFRNELLDSGIASLGTPYLVLRKDKNLPSLTQ